MFDIDLAFVITLNWVLCMDKYIIHYHKAHNRAMLWHTSLQIVKEFTEHPPEPLPMSHHIPVQTGSSMFYVPLSPPPSSTTFMYSSAPHTVTSDEWGTRRPAPPSIVSADLFQCTLCVECVLHVLVSCYYPSPQAAPARSRYVPPSLPDQLEDIGQMRWIRCVFTTLFTSLEMKTL